MSNNQFIEALSADPYVRGLSRRAVRLLNDPTLDRQQREHHIRQIQSLLAQHQAKEAAKAMKLSSQRHDFLRQPKPALVRGWSGARDG